MKSNHSSLSLSSVHLVLSFRKLVQYCVLKGYLRRVREYRISLDDSIDSNNNGNADENAKTKLKKTLRDLCDGTHDIDSLACLGYSMYYSRD